MTQRTRSLPVTALTACILGLVLCPTPYLLAARSELSLAAFATLVPPFVLSVGILLLRFLGKPSSETTGGVAMRLLELASWTVVVSFLLFISQVRLLRGIERWGVACTFFLSASLVCLPLVWVRHTALEQRLTRLPRVVIVSALCAVLVLSGLMLFAYLTTPTRFI